MRLPAKQRIILSIDSSDPEQAKNLARLAKCSGARFIKLGLELSTATSWKWCSELARDEDLEWIADAKLDDIPNTVQAAVRNLKNLPLPPFGITMHTTAGRQAMSLAQQEADSIIVFGVTILTSIPAETGSEGEAIYHVPVSQKVLELAHDAAAAGLTGLVASPLEVSSIKKDDKTRGLLTMIPGVRSSDADRGDQTRVSTPAEAVKNGADLLVIGRQITQAKDSAAEYKKVVAEIESAL